MSFFQWAAPMFARHGDRWDETEVRQLGDRLRSYVPEGGRLLDVGGGTGALAAHLADELRCDVTVLDATSEMLAYMPKRPDVHGLLGCAESMPFEDGQFDAVVVSDAFHHFRDQDAAIDEIRRVLRPGGALLMLEFDPRGLMRVVAWVEKLLGEPAAFFTPEGLCRYLEARGIRGECREERGVTYSFLGEAD